jgi:hypothetical protein
MPCGFQAALASRRDLEDRSLRGWAAIPRQPSSRVGLLHQPCGLLSTPCRQDRERAPSSCHAASLPTRHGSSLSRGFSGWPVGDTRASTGRAPLRTAAQHFADSSCPERPAKHADPQGHVEAGARRPVPYRDLRHRPDRARRAGRSQMAAVWLRHLAGNAVEVRSAGSEPADHINPIRCPGDGRGRHRHHRRHASPLARVPRTLDLVVLPTAEAIDVFTKSATDTNAVLHLTC